MGNSSQLTLNSYLVFINCYVLWRILGLGELSAKDFFFVYKVQLTHVAMGMDYFQTYNALLKGHDKDNNRWRNIWFYAPAFLLGFSSFVLGSLQSQEAYELSAPLLENISMARTCDPMVHNYFFLSSLE